MSFDNIDISYLIDVENPIYLVFKPVIDNIPVEKRNESLRMLLVMFYELNRNIVIYQKCIEDNKNELDKKSNEIRELNEKNIGMIEINNELIKKLNKYKKMLENETNNFNELKILNKSNIRKLKDEKNKIKKHDKEHDKEIKKLNEIINNYKIEILELKKYINIIMEEMYDNKIQEALRRY